MNGQLPALPLVLAIRKELKADPDLKATQAFCRVNEEHPGLIKGLCGEKNPQKRNRFEKFFEETKKQTEKPLIDAMLGLQELSSNFEETLVEAAYTVDPENARETREWNAAINAVKSAGSEHQREKAVEDLVEMLKMKDLVTEELQADYDTLYPLIEEDEE